MIDTIRQFKISPSMTAAMAIRGCVCGRYFRQQSTGPFCLVDEQLKVPRPGRIGNTFSQTMIFQHIEDHQILNANDAKRLDSLGVIVNRYTSNAISIASLLDGGVEKLTTNSQRLRQQSFLLMSWINAVFVSFSHWQIIPFANGGFNEFACIYAGFLIFDAFPI
jgi:hypothetical protein